MAEIYEFANHGCTAFAEHPIHVNGAPAWKFTHSTLPAPEF